MKFRTVLFSVCFTLIAATLALAAADVNGKWVAQVPGRDGTPRETTFTFKVEAGKLTGTVSGRQGDTAITDGKIEGDTISFAVVRNIQGNEVKQTYTGKVTGDEIKFKREGGQGGGQPQEFVAKRAK